MAPVGNGEGGTEEPLVWRVPTAVRAMAVLVFLLFVALATLLTSIDATPIGALVFWAATLVVLLGVWRWFLQPYVALTPEYLVVQGVFFHRAEPYATITAATPGLYGMKIETAGTDDFVAWAVQKSKVSEWLDRTTPADRAAAAIMDRAAAASRAQERADVAPGAR